MTDILSFKDISNNSITLRKSSGGWVMMVNEVNVFSFDLRGRPRHLLIDGKTFRRGTDHRTFQVYPPGQRKKNLFVRELCDKEKRCIYENFINECKKNYTSLINHVRGGGLSAGKKKLGEKAVTFFSFLENNNPGSEWEKDYERFHQLYKTISILPPDQYRALVVQVSEGCPWNRCTFCTLYGDRKFHPKSIVDVRNHIKSITDFYGKSIDYYNSIFLADANAMAINSQKLVEVMELLQPLVKTSPSIKSINSFVDVKSGYNKSGAVLKKLHELGMKRLYLGLESGSEETRKFLNKPGSNREIKEFVNNCHYAGIGVGVIILIGVGGDKYADIHTNETCTLLKELSLRKRDIIYLSKFVEHPGSAYHKQSRDEKIRSLTDDEMEYQVEQVKSECKGFYGDDTPNISVYTLDRFIY